MARIPNLGSLRSIANYGEDEVDSDEEAEVARKKVKIDSNNEDIGSKESSDLDIVVSDEDDDSSRSGFENKTVISQPRVNIASRLVSYGEDEDEETAKIRVAEMNNETEEQEKRDETEQKEKGDDISENKTLPIDDAKTVTTQADDRQQETEELPEKLREHLAIIKAIKVSLPEEPDGRCSNTLQEKIEKLLETKLKTGRDLKETIQRKKNFRNPSIYEKLVSFCSINETGTNYPPEIYDPFSWTEESFYENLSKLQKENHEKKQRERSKVEFVTATKKTVALSDESKRRRSKWDVTSSGTAAPLKSTVQSSVAAAKAKIINAVANVQAKKAS